MLTQQQRNKSVAVTFAVHYYCTLMKDPAELIPLYCHHAQFTHRDRGGRETGIENIRNSLITLYPKNFGRITILSLALTAPTGAGGDSNDSLVAFMVEGKFFPSASSAQEMGMGPAGFKHLIELREHYPNSNTFGVYTDWLRWQSYDSAMISTSLNSTSSTTVSQGGSILPPMTSFGVNWTETPEMHSKKPPLDRVSPIHTDEIGDAMTKTVAVKQPAIVDHEPAAPPSKPSPQKVDKQHQPSTTSTTNSQQPLKSQQQGNKKPAEGGNKPQEVPAPSQQSHTTASQPKQDEKDLLDNPNLTMAERIRIKQGLPPPSEDRKKVNKPQGDEQQQKGKRKGGKDNNKSAPEQAGGGADGKKEATNASNNSEQKKESAVGKNKAGGEKVTEDPKSSGPKGAATTTTTTTGTSNSNAQNITFYDAILKGLPHDATVEEVQGLIENHITLQIPLKLDINKKAGAKADETRTFAFAMFNRTQLEKQNMSIDEMISLLRKKRLSLRGHNVVVDRVREKFT